MVAQYLPAQSLPTTRTIRVASVPAGHVYVRHIGVDGDGVVRLPDPPPAGRDTAPGQWWPPAMLSAAWVHRHADKFDVFHVHFGFDALATGDLEDVADALAACGKPLVYTVHDLRNPHHGDPSAHDDQLDVLVRRADALITLTPGAAAEIERRWGRRATVVAHPHVVALDRTRGPARPDGRDFVVGLHLKSLRANMDPAAVLAGLLPLVGELPGLRLRVDVHHDVADEDGRRHQPALMATLRAAERQGSLALHVHDCFTDDELWDYLEGLDVSVLPYRFGTHSGWLEACHDLGTAVAAPTCGFYAEQQPCLDYRVAAPPHEPDSVQSAVRRGYGRRTDRTAGSAGSARSDGRADQRRAIAAAHRAVYESVLR